MHSLNLHSGNFHSVKSLVHSVSADMDLWLKHIVRSIDSISFSRAITLNLTQKVGPSCSLIDELNQLLKNVTKELPPRSMIGRKQVPILFIDEANRLCSLLRDKDGQAAIESLYQWFIQHIKEKKQFHVNLASSDSFFHLWVEQFMGSSRYTTYVLGHLDEDETRRYWEYKVLKDHDNMLKKASNSTPDFESVFSICGGSMFLMKLFCIEHCVDVAVKEILSIFLW